MTAPKHLSAVKIHRHDYGDYTEAVWGVSWQGQYIYVGATNNGIKVVDASDPANLKIAAEVPTSSFGGVSAGPVDAIGNVLVVMTPKESSGIATLDISDPTVAVRLASSRPRQVVHHAVPPALRVFSADPVLDVLTNPKNIGSGSSPLCRSTRIRRILGLQDDYLFIGHARHEIGGLPGARRSRSPIRGA